MLSCSFQFAVVAFVNETGTAMILQVYLEMKNGFLLASLAASKIVREIANRWFRWLSGNVPYSCRWLRDASVRLVMVSSKPNPSAFPWPM